MTKKDILRIVRRTVCVILAILLLLIAAFTVFVLLNRNTDLAGVRGVNLGSWLVLERWMTPEVFEGTNAYDEYTLARALPADEYAELMHAHRSTFVTEGDFKAIAEMGLNTIRIPIPYYIFGDRAGEPYIACIDELDNAFDWAEKYGLGCVLGRDEFFGQENSSFVVLVKTKPAPGFRVLACLRQT